MKTIEEIQERYGELIIYKKNIDKDKHPKIKKTILYHDLQIRIETYREILGINALNVKVFEV